MFERRFEGKGEKNVKGNEKMVVCNKNGKLWRRVGLGGGRVYEFNFDYVKFRC